MLEILGALILGFTLLKVKQAKIFTLPASAEKYDQLIKEFQMHFKTH